MSGLYADEFGGGPSDDGVGMAAWRLSHRLQGAREEFVEAAREKAVSPLLRVLLDRLGASEGGGVR